MSETDKPRVVIQPRQHYGDLTEYIVEDSPKNLGTKSFDAILDTYYPDTPSDEIGYSGEETIDIPMPTSFRVLVHWSRVKQRWVSKVILTATDVTDPEFAEDYFSCERIYDERPTCEEIAEHAAAAMEHEIREQLGLRPHEEGTSK